ncbi:nucleotidyltransferase domain-containing protein [Polaromonas sp. P2-4]|nr:nucleotidyltransferase domain-containing protein [Polaromonas sp. P2-4]
MNHTTLAELFGSADRFRALRTIFSEPGRGFGQRELAKAADIDPGNVSRLLKRWVEAGIVQRVQKDGLPRYYATRDPSLAPLVMLMQQDRALVHALRNFLADVDGVQVAVIFGSIARGDENADSDIDVLVLGSVSELKLNTLLKPVGRELGRPVHASVSTAKAFRNQVQAGESFAREIVRGPKIALKGDFDAAVISETER